MAPQGVVMTFVSETSKEQFVVEEMVYCLALVTERMDVATGTMTVTQAVPAKVRAGPAKVRVALRVQTRPAAETEMREATEATLTEMLAMEVLTRVEAKVALYVTVKTKTTPGAVVQTEEVSGKVL